MDMKKEFVDLIENINESIESSFINLMCISKALSSLDEKIFGIEKKNEENLLFSDSLDLINQVADNWINKLINKKVISQDVIELFEDSHTVNVLTSLLYKDLTVEFKTKINLILDKLFMNLPIAKKNYTAFYLFLMIRCQLFKEYKSKEKFDLCEKICLILELNLKYCLDNSKVKNCIRIISETVFEVIKNKLNHELRKPIFKMCAIITSINKNLEWIFVKNEERNSFLLLTRLSIVEARISLEKKNYNIFFDSLVLIEFTIKFLIENYLDEEKNLEKKEDNFLSFLSNKDLIQLIDSLKSFIKSIIIYLNENLNYIHNKDSNEYFLWIACLRILCVYLISENEFLKKDFAFIVDIIFEYLKKTQKQSNENEELIVLTIHALRSICENDQECKKKIIEFQKFESKNLGIIDDLNDK